MNAAAAPPPTAVDDKHLRAVLHASAFPLVVLASQLRRAVPETPESIGPALAAAVARFESELVVAGWDERGVAAASYVLCVWVDEVVADTPWGDAQTTLLERFHGEREGGVRAMKLLSILAQRPLENQALLELFHACLSLGLTGRRQKDPDAVQQLETLRRRLFLTLPGETTMTLAPPWQAAVKPARPSWQRHAGIAALVLLGLAALGVYTAAHLSLAARVDEVFASMLRLAVPGTVGSPLPDVGAHAGAVPQRRLAPLFEQDVAAGLVSVRDETNRSVIAVPAAALFEPGSTQLSTTGRALLARIGVVLANTGGKVVVTGHTDGLDKRSARFPSPWHQSFEWARATATSLGDAVSPERLAVEGAAASGTAGEAALPPRRVDIALYP